MLEKGLYWHIIKQIFFYLRTYFLQYYTPSLKFHNRTDIIGQPKNIDKSSQMHFFSLDRVEKRHHFLGKNDQ